MKRLFGFCAGLIILLALFFVLQTDPAGAASAPPVTHPITGAACLTCHGTQGPKPVPATHSAFPEGACLSCHAAAAAPPATPAPAATSATPTPAATTKPPAAPNDSCLGCHGQPGLTMPLGNDKLSLYVDPKAYAGSIHGSNLLCTDCHSAITGYPHPRRQPTDSRQYSITQYELCKKCHFDNYTKTLDSVHYKMLSGGNLQAPLCTDCHGAHNVTAPTQPRSNVSQTCAQCHQDLYQTYIASVHGKALAENNADVPVCTDCHRSHTIEDPRTASFRLGSVKLCSNCHTNEQVMNKYGISTAVVQTYLQDFHGKSVALASQENKSVWVDEAVCTDCHGVHNIMKVDSVSSPVIKANLVATCQSCHPGATLNFPSAWLSHYQPSPTQAPLVYFARWFYMLMIPFVLVGLSVHILLDLWRAITNR